MLLPLALAARWTGRGGQLRRNSINPDYPLEINDAALQVDQIHVMCVSDDVCASCSQEGCACEK